MDIVKTRIEREFEIPLIATAPNVEYEVITLQGEKLDVDNPAKFPDPGIIKEILEPFVTATIVTGCVHPPACCRRAISALTWANRSGRAAKLMAEEYTRDAT